MNELMKYEIYQLTEASKPKERNPITIKWIVAIFVYER